MLALSIIAFVFAGLLVLIWMSRRTRGSLFWVTRIILSLLVGFVAMGFTVVRADSLVGTDWLAFAIGGIAGLAAFAGLLFLLALRRQVPETLRQPPAEDARADTRTTAQVAEAPRAARARVRAERPETIPDVFISYKRDERPEVIDIARRLEALQLKVWFDAELRSGTSFDAEIDRQVRRAKCVLVCWSPGATGSDWVRSEATIGRERNVLAAAVLKPCELPTPFNLFHAEDLSGGVDAQREAWTRLAERIGALVGRPGLGPFVGLGPTPSPSELALWMAEHPDDAMFEAAATRLKGGSG